MEEELDWFQKNDVWKLVELPNGKKVVGAKWVFRNKWDENGKVVTNKARLVTKGYSQQEGIYYKKIKKLCTSSLSRGNMHFTFIWNL